MSGRDALEEATSRLLAVLTEFEDAVKAQLKDGESIDSLQAQVQSLMAEREQLYESLEAERRRAERLEAASEEVWERLGGVIDRVKAITHTG